MLYRRNYTWFFFKEPKNEDGFQIRFLLVVFFVFFFKIVWCNKCSKCILLYFVAVCNFSWIMLVKSLMKLDTLEVRCSLALAAQSWPFAQAITVKTNNPCRHNSNIYLHISLSFIFCRFSFASTLPLSFLIFILFI